MQDTRDDDEKKEKHNYSVIKYTSGNKIQDIALLNKDFDLHNVPKNYLRRRSQVEDLIFRTVASETQKKAPMASFKLANDYLHRLQELDILTGIKCLKSLVKLPFDSSKQVSMMIHRVGDTVLLDEFDVNSFFLEITCSGKWQWFRDFLIEKEFHLDKPDFSRKALVKEDLYGKFLYHSVNNTNPHLLPLIECPPDYSESTHRQGDARFTPIFSLSSSPPRPVWSGLKNAFQSESSDRGSSNQKSFTTSFSSSHSAYEEEFLQKVEWQMEDLSYLVGSDLAIFGTKTHPCISLKLSHLGRPISVLTGLDMWLENIINEIPEVAMCYHDEGIVMQEYEIYKTSELPKVAGFQEFEVHDILRNIVVFLKRNATKEGHTYWLFKEKNSELVKLYDLTSLKRDAESTKSKEHLWSKEDDHNRNPFILPVAVLCFRLAERRMQQHQKFNNTSLHSSPYSEQEEMLYYNDTFRLLRNCVNIMSRPTGQQLELLCRATLLMCQLYLEADAAGMTRCFRVIEESSPPSEVSFNVEQLRDRSNFEFELGDSVDLSQISPTQGQNIVNAFKSGKLDDILSVAFTTVDRINDNAMALVASPPSGETIFYEHDQTISERVILLLIDTYRSMAEKIFLELKSQSTDQPCTEREFLIRLCKGVRDSYFAYLLMEKLPSYPHRLSVLECFTHIFLHFLNFDLGAMLNQQDYPALTTVDQRVINLINNPAINLIANRLHDPKTLTRSYQCLTALVDSLYRTIQLYQTAGQNTKSLLNNMDKEGTPNYKARIESVRSQSLPIALNQLVSRALVPIRLLDQWNDQLYGNWPHVLSQILDNLNDSISSLVSTNAIMASVLASCRARLYRLEAATVEDVEYVESCYCHALDSYTDIKNILKKATVSPEIWNSTQRDIFMTCMQYYDMMFKKACQNSTEPDIQILKRAVALISDYLSCDTTRLPDAVRVLHTLLRVRHVIGCWYLGLRNEKTVNHESMIKDLKLSYDFICDNEEHYMDIFTVITYLVTIQTSRKDTLSVRCLRNILEDAVKVEASLNRIISESKVDSLIEINSELLIKSLLAVVQKLVLKMNYSKSKKSPPDADSNEVKNLYANLLRSQSNVKEKSLLHALCSMIELIKPFIKQL